MEYEQFDISQWERRELYEHFSRLRNPFYAVAANVDVSNLIEYKRREGLSFYLSLIYLATEAINAIDNFHLRIVDGHVVRFSTIHPNFTHKGANEAVFRFFTSRMEGTLSEFARRCEAAMKDQTTLFGGHDHSPNLIYFSSFPWAETTAITNPGMEDADDGIPRINWGRYGLHDGRYLLNITVTANHRFIDGWHIGLFFRQLQERIDRLGDSEKQ